MPVFKSADPSKPDLDVVSKVLQRADSVNALTPKAFESLYADAGWSTDGLEEFLDKRAADAEAAATAVNESKAGGANGGTSGTGNSQSGKSGGSNTNNSVAKSLRVEGDRIIDNDTDEVVNLEELDDEGNYK
jgi:hypothetical protein